MCASPSYELESRKEKMQGIWAKQKHPFLFFLTVDTLYHAMPSQLAVADCVASNCEAERTLPLKLSLLRYLVIDKRAVANTSDKRKKS